MEMTREEIIAELQHQATNKYLIYLALQEIMLDNYEDCKLLKDYDHDLTVKHKNMINALKRNATKAYRFLEQYDQGESTIKQFHDFVRLFEGLHLAIDSGGIVFHDCLNEVEKILIKNGLKESIDLPK
jgi:hypothetical protein